MKNKRVNILLSLKKIIISVIRYYDGNLYDFHINSDGQIALRLNTKSSNRNYFTVIARNRYTETNESYPIEKPGEIHKLLRLEHEGGSLTRYYLHKPVEGQTSVNIWTYNQDIPNSWITIPETVLLAKYAKDNQIVHVQCEREFFIGKVNDVIFSTNKGTVIKSSTLFANAFGLSRTHQDVVIKLAELPTLLINALRFLNFSFILRCMKPIQYVISKKLIKGVLIPVLAIFTLNMLISSFYLLYKEVSLEDALANQSESVTSALSAQENIAQRYARYLELKTFLLTQNSRSPFWLVMADIFPKALFTNIRTEGNRFIIRGSAENALALLGELNSNPYVKDAKFDYPVQKRSAAQTFVISFEIPKISPENVLATTITNKEYSHEGV